MDVQIPIWPKGFLQVLEDKGKYFERRDQQGETKCETCKMTDCRIRCDEVDLKCKEDELARFQEQVAACEADIRKSEDKLEARDVALRRQNKDSTESSFVHDKKWKYPRYTQ